MSSVERSLRIAVAEDETDTREFLRQCLSRAGHQVLEASDGEELLKLCATQAPDLIVTDIRMPIVNGLQAVAAANHGNVLAPVVLVTSYPEEDIRRGDGGWVMACLCKPIKAPDLLAAVDLAVRRFGEMRQSAASAAASKQALEDRKLIERAKGCVMKRLRVEEDEAYRRLQRYASEHNLKLVEAARRIDLADEAYRQLEAGSRETRNGSGRAFNG